MLPTRILFTLLLPQALCTKTTLQTSERDKILENFIYKYLTNTLVVICRNSDDSITRIDVPKILHDPGKEYNFALTAPYNYDYVIIDDKINIEKTAVKLYHNTALNKEYKYVLALDNLTENETSKMFLLLWKYNIYNIVIYVNRTHFYTWYPYGNENQCGKKSFPAKVNKENPFTGKVPQQVNGCILNVTWNKNKVMVISPFYNTKGVTIDVLEIIGRKINVSFNYLKGNIRYQNVIERKKQHMTLFDTMFKQKLHLATLGTRVFTCQLMTLRGLVLSNDIYVEAVYFVLPPRDKIEPNTYIFNMYQPELFFCILAVFAFICLLLKLTKKESMLLVTLQTLQLHVQQPITNMPGNSAMRVMLACFFLYYICIFTAWQSELSSTLTKPHYEPKIATAKQLIESRLSVDNRFNITSCNLLARGDIPEEELVNRFKEEDDVDPERHLEFLRKPPLAAAVGELTILKTKNVHQLEIIKEKVDNLRHRFAALNGFPLMDRINYWILRIKEVGLVVKLIRDGATPVLMTEGNTVMEQSPIRFEQMTGAFLTLLVGLVISIVVFYFELIVYYG